MKLLSRAEEIILLAILKLKENAYGVAIRERVYEETGTEWSFASIYTPLNKLTRKKYVKKRYGEPTNERGGRRKCLYEVTGKGIAALREMRKVQENVWTGVPDVLFDNGE
jgi:DNA-binding PadR family transcriptional regulator